MNRLLTGVKPTGTPHLGNYVGAIKPAIERSKSPEGSFFYFIADIHALNGHPDSKELKRYSLEVAATWLALGLDHERVVFYKESDVPEITELCAILGSSAAKGLMNRAHAYKAKVDDNLANQRDRDDGVNMGLFNYPLLMAADILAFQATHVPVSADQFQHLEMTRDIGASFNARYGEELFVLPKPYEESPLVLPGLDGRKMSKSYGNTIPLFMPQGPLRKLINKITTDSTPPEEPKSTDATVFKLYAALASPEETQTMRVSFEQGISWGSVKTHIFEVLDRQIEEPRRRYEELIANPDLVNKLLLQGASKARDIAAPLLSAVRKTVGF